MVVGLLDGSGLRLMEDLRLRVKDLNLERRELTVRGGKGRNDRLTVLPQNLVPALKEYRLGVRSRHHLDPSVVQKAVKRAALEAGVTKATNYHPFRPSFATHLLERGQDIGTIQELLGHKDGSTPTIYTHVLNRVPLWVQSPADIL